MPSTVVHWNDRGPNAVLIDRTTPFGNPFRVPQDGDRAQVIAKFKDYFHRRLQEDPVFWRQVQGLIGRELACHCKPMDCHGDVIVEYLKRQYGA